MRLIRALSGLAAFGIAFTAVSSCGGGSSSGPNPTPTILAKSSANNGDAQTSVVAVALPLPLSVVVTKGGTPQANVSVAWATSGTGASMNPPASTTDANGVATSTWTISQTAGAQSATASVTGATGSPLTFAATGTADVAALFTKVSGDAQTKQTNAAFSQPLVAKLTDQFSNPIIGQTVTWAVTSGSASISPPNGSTGTAGTASATLTAGGTTGPVTVSATPPGGLTLLTYNETVTVAPVVVNVTNNFYTSAHNGTVNPAVDTVSVGQPVEWDWLVTGTHGIESTGNPSFTSGPAQTSGSYSVIFNVAGTYQYDCSIHGSAMTGRIVAQ